MIFRPIRNRLCFERQLYQRLTSRGFALVELLVVIAIIGILIALLLPAVQAAREAARRMACQNNLKQIGTAIQNYHDRLNSFPSGFIANAPYPSTSNGWGWSTLILPFLEQTSIYDQVQFMLPIEHAANSTTIRSRIPGYLCPSDPSVPDHFTIYSATGNAVADVAPSSYAATAGDDSVETDTVTGNGLFYRNSHRRMADILDGTSHTVMVGDRSWAMTKGAWCGAPNSAVVQAGPTNPWALATAVPSTFILVHNNYVNVLNDSDGGLDDFSSFHPGGVQLIMADGSVRFVANIGSDGPARQAFWAMGTCAGGEPTEGVP